MLRVAHRGYTDTDKHQPNSFYAFYNAFINGFDMIEMDIQLCKSGEIVIHHDIHIENKYIADLTLTELATHRIRTLHDFFQEVYNTNMKIMLDIKGSNNGIVSALIQLLLDSSLENSTIVPENLFVCSYNKKIVRTLQCYKSSYAYRVGLITSNNFYDEVDMFYQLENIDFLSIDWVTLVNDTDKDTNTSSLITYCTLHSKQLFTFTAHNDIEVNLILPLNPSGIISNVII